MANKITNPRAASAARPDGASPTLVLLELDNGMRVALKPLESSRQIVYSIDRSHQSIWDAYIDEQVHAKARRAGDQGQSVDPTPTRNPVYRAPDALVQEQARAQPDVSAQIISSMQNLLRGTNPKFNHGESNGSSEQASQVAGQDVANPSSALATTIINKVGGF